ncbi:MAG: hypothetical protein KAI66_04775, partial [Lentisphaeria bacterium]|nr:hypothetical protein [Lentisphaeria bacterium]
MRNWRLSTRGVLALLCLLSAGVSVQARSRRSRSRNELRYKCWVLEDAEDRACTGWGVWDDDPPGKFRNAKDPDDRKNRAIQLLSGSETAYEFIFPKPHKGGSIIQWRMRMYENFYHYVACETSMGMLHVRYTPGNAPPKVQGLEPVLSLDMPDYQEEWVTVRRDVLQDLRTAQPDIELVAILGVKFRGLGHIDDIRVYDYKDTDHDLLPDQFEERRRMDPKDPSDATARLIKKVTELTDSVEGSVLDVVESKAKDKPKKTARKRRGKKVVSRMDPRSLALAGNGYRYEKRVVEDAEEGDTVGWTLFDADPPGQAVNVVDPDDPGNRVIELQANYSTGHKFTLSHCETNHPILEWRMRMTGTFYFYAVCSTSVGAFNIRYCTGTDVSNYKLDPVVGIGDGLSNGSWVTIRRNLVADIRTLYPDAELYELRTFMARGVGCLDDIVMLSYPDADLDLLPDDLEDQWKLNPRDPSDATPQLIAKVIELTNSTKDRPPHKKDTKTKESREDKRRRYRVVLTTSEREGLQACFEELLAKRLEQAPKPQIGRVYRVRMRAGGEIKGRLEKFAAGRITLGTQHGKLVLPIHRVSRRDTLALFPREAARQMAMRDVQKRVDRLIEKKVRDAGKVAAAAKSVVAAATVTENHGGGPVADTDTDRDSTIRRTRVDKPTYDTRTAPTPEEIKPALQEF